MKIYGLINNMATNILKNYEYKRWFLFRKGIFQVFLPILLAFITFVNYVDQSGNDNSYAYHHLYFYTSLILFLYGSVSHILNFIFSICSDDVMFKKEISLDKTTTQLFLPSVTDLRSDNYFIIIIKKIFKLRYSNSQFFVYIDKVCWYLGIDSPILIPANVVNRLNKTKNISESENDDSILKMTLINLYNYHPTLYEVKPLVEIDDNTNTATIENTSLMPNKVITHVDRMICDLQKDLFNKDNEIDVSSNAV